MPLFGRLEPHRYDSALNELIASGDEERRCLARNLICDDRVSSERADALSHFTGGGGVSGDGLLEAIHDYHFKRVENAKEPDYMDPALNGLNFMRLRNLDVQLVRVLDLSGLRLIFEWAKAQTAALKLSTYPAAEQRVLRHFKGYKQGTIESLKWLKVNLESAAADDFVGAILTVVAIYSKDHPHQPAWATPWATFSAHRNSTPDRWLELVGVHREYTKPGDERILILLKYRLRDAGTIVRPTQLDAGLNCRHFPSPARLGAPLGHPMDLRHDPELEVLRHELIHGQLLHDVTHWQAADRAYGIARPIPGALAGQRLGHYRLLSDKYGKRHVESWMPKC